MQKVLVKPGTPEERTVEFRSTKELNKEDFSAVQSALHTSLDDTVDSLKIMRKLSSGKRGMLAIQILYFEQYMNKIISGAIVEEFAKPVTDKYRVKEWNQKMMENDREDLVIVNGVFTKDLPKESFWDNEAAFNYDTDTDMDFGETVEDVVDSVMEVAEDIKESVKETVEDAADSVMEAAEDIKDIITPEVSETVEEPVMEAAEDIITPEVSEIVEVEEPVMEAAEDIKDSVTPEASETVEVEEPVMEAAEEIKSLTVIEPEIAPTVDEVIEDAVVIKTEEDSVPDEPIIPIGEAVIEFDNDKLGLATFDEDGNNIANPLLLEFSNLSEVYPALNLLWKPSRELELYLQMTRFELNPSEIRLFTLNVIDVNRVVVKKFNIDPNVIFGNGWNLLTSTPGIENIYGELPIPFNDYNMVVKALSGAFSKDDHDTIRKSLGDDIEYVMRKIDMSSLHNFTKMDSKSRYHNLINNLNIALTTAMKDIEHKDCRFRFIEFTAIDNFKLVCDNLVTYVPSSYLVDQQINLTEGRWITFNGRKKDNVQTGIISTSA